MRKTCPHCGQSKPTAEFHRNRARPDGLQSWCKTCFVEEQQHRYRNPERGLLMDARRKAAAAATDKVCTKCNERKPLDAFYVSRKQMSGRTPRCKSCQREDLLETRAADPEGHARGRLALVLRRKYDLTLDQYDAMLEAQGSVCAICRKPETKRRSKGEGIERLAVDHCHETGKVRALLCRGCNHAMGSAGDDPTLLRRMADYIERYRR